MAKDEESGADAVSDPYKTYIDYGLARAQASVKCSLGIDPETKVKVIIPMPSVE